MDLGAILLAGGRASRMDGAAKPLFDVGGRSLLQRAVDAVADCAPLTVVAPPVRGLGDQVTWAREDPPFSGPAAAVVAALREWRGRPALPEWTFLIACDLPGVEAAVARLRRDLPLVPGETEGLCLADAGSRPQWLTGVYRTAALVRGADALPESGRNASLRALLDDVAIAVVVAPEAETDDVDTWDDLERARARFGEEALASPRASSHRRQKETPMSDKTLPPEALDAWAAALREKFDLAPEELPIPLVLDLARDVAHGVARPAAPFSAFVAGLVAGRAGGSAADVEKAVADVVALAAGWEA